MTKKAITNQRTPQEIKEIVSDIDKEVPDVKEFVEIMEKEDQDKETQQFEDEDLKIEDADEDPQQEDGIAVDEGDEDPEQPTPPVKPKLPPLDQRYKEAGQEAMILNSKNKKILDTIEEAENLPEPTMDDLKIYAKEMGTEYDDLDTFAQNVLKENLQNKRRFSKISDLVAQEKQVSNWVNKVKDFVDTEDFVEKYPDVSVDSEEFLKYASKKSHIGADLDLLVAGFLWKQPNKPKKSVLLPSGKGSPLGSQPKKSIDPTEEDARLIRKRDHKQYKEMIKRKKFKIDL